MHSKKLIFVLTIVLAAVIALAGCGAGSTDEAGGKKLEPAVGENGSSNLTAVITADEIPALDEIEGLSVADLRGSECYEEIYAWAKAHPQVIVYYDVALPTGETVGNRVTSLDLSTLSSSQVDEALRCLSCLPKVVRAELGSERSNFTLDDVKKLQDACPNTRFSYAFTLYGQSVTTEDTELQLSHVPVDDEGAAAHAAMAVMPKLTYVDMDSCGVSNEAMAALRDAFPAVNVVWRVWFGEAYSVRTDAEMILASKPSKGGMLTPENTQALKYCTGCRYLDVGHNEELTDISFVGYMPKLEVAILAMDNWSDASALANCKALEYLEIFSTNVSDLSPLAELTSLRHINLCVSSVSDISPLYNLTKLERLWLGGYVNVPAEQVAKMQECAPNCEINTTCGDPTEGRWRLLYQNEFSYIWTYQPRYVRLREQFKDYADSAFSFYWNDPLY